MKPTNPIIFTLLVLTVMSGCATTENNPAVTTLQPDGNFIFLFEENVFLIPSGFSVAAYFSEYPRAIHFGYGSAKNRNYIVFFDGLGGGEKNPGCNLADYAKSIFDANPDAACDAKMVRDDIKDFVKGADTGRWYGKNGETIYYSIGGLVPSLFVVDKNRKLIYITFDAPDVGKGELKKIVEKLL